jgi:hypothetical protein
MSRYQMTPEKTEMVGGRLYGTEEERLTMLALLLENVGADKQFDAILGLPEPNPVQKPDRWKPS